MVKPRAGSQLPGRRAFLQNLCHCLTNAPDRDAQAFIDEALPQSGQPSAPIPARPGYPASAAIRGTSRIIDSPAPATYAQLALGDARSCFDVHRYDGHVRLRITRAFSADAAARDIGMFTDLPAERVVRGHVSRASHAAQVAPGARRS